MENSLISWCDHTQNFWIGCTQVSPGCYMCYAETLDRNRFSKLLDGGTKTDPVGHWGKGAPRHRTSIHLWNEPLRWNRVAKAGFFAEVTRAGKFIARGDLRRLVKVKDAAGVHLIQEGDTVIKVRPRVFCSSLADILDPEVAPKMLAEALDVIRRCDGLDWLLLTKRPELWRHQMQLAYLYANQATQQWLQQWLTGTPPAQVWVMATMEDQLRFNLRWKALADIPAVVRGISMEPMLSAIDMSACLKSEFKPFHWVITGGESGDDAKDESGKVIRSPRPMHPDWVRSIRGQCRIAGFAFHHKQWGAWREPDTFAEEDASVWVAPSGRVFKDVMEIPDSLLGSAQMFRDGRKAPGRMLDGIEHNAFPEVRR